VEKMQFLMVKNVDVNLDISWLVENVFNVLVDKFTIHHQRNVLQYVKLMKSGKQIDVFVLMDFTESQVLAKNVEKIKYINHIFKHVEMYAQMEEYGLTTNANAILEVTTLTIAVIYAQLTQNTMKKQANAKKYVN
jgi:hypothetical protein